jgi:hypothetical protein
MHGGGRGSRFPQWRGAIAGVAGGLFVTPAIALPQEALASGVLGAVVGGNRRTFRGKNVSRSKALQG